MVYYKDNPNLKSLQVVTTVKGDQEYRKNTKYLGEKYHTISRDCIQLENKWYTIDSNNIIYDHELKTYQLKRYVGANVVYGLILQDEKIEMGYFTSNKYNNVLTISNEYGKIWAINSEILVLTEDSWFEDNGGNIWYRAKDMTPRDVLARKKIRNEKSYTDRGYNIEDNVDYPQKIELYNKYNTPISIKAHEMSKYLGDITFGAELELNAGNLGTNLRNRYGIVLCRDGSLNGGAELVTIPLSGAKGLQTLVDIGNDLKTRSIIDLSCSFHLHFGNFQIDKLTIIALYRLSRSIQNELFTMFPYYKVEPAGVKQKNYTKKLLKLNIHSLKDTSKEAYELYLMDCWSKLFNFYSEGLITLDEFDKKSRKHPIERKWERKNRYFYMNFFNLFFGHRHTVEARLHSGTTNPHKMINWLFMCVAIIRYAERNTMDIIRNDRTIAFKEVLDVYKNMFPKDPKASFISKYLYEYFLQRQARCKKDLEIGDYVSIWDVKEDKDYKFTYENVCGLI